MKKLLLKKRMPRAALLSVMVACSLSLFTGQALAGKANDTLVYASDSEPENVSPYHNNLREGVILSHLAWSTLIYRDPNTGEYLPHLATAWEWEDETRLLLTLRENVLFHNGDAFSAKDVAFTFNYVTTPEARVVTQQNVDWIDHAEIVSDSQVRLILKQPFPAAMEYLSGPTPIYPEQYFSQVGLEGFARAPVGTGPYRITNVLSGRGVHLERFDDYFEGGPIAKPAIGKIQFEVIPDPEARIAQLMTGGVDWIWRVPSDQADAMQNMPGIEVVSGETMRVGYLSMDAVSEVQEDSPFKNKLVRQAVNHAIDRDVFSEQLVRGGSRSLYTPCFPDQFGCDVSAAKQYEYDPEKARALLAEAGYPNGFTTNLYAYRERDLAEAMMGYLAAVGINTRLHYPTYAALRTEQRAGNVPITFQTWGSFSVNDVSAMISVYFKGGPDDVSQNAELIALLEKADTTIDSEQRQQYYSQAIEIITEEAYWAPMFSYSSNYAFNEELSFQPYPDELPRFYEASWK